MSEDNVKKKASADASNSAEKPRKESPSMFLSEVKIKPIPRTNDLPRYQAEFIVSSVEFLDRDSLGGK